MNLKGKTALVTGAGRRLGRAIARALAEAGAGVVIHYRGSEGEAESLRRELSRRGAKAWLVGADLATGSDDLAERARAEAGRPLQILVNSAGVFPQGEIGDLAWEDLSAAFRVNAWAPFALSRGFARQTKSGVIVNLLDSMERRASLHRAAYALSKRALEELTRMSALAFAPGIRVNGVALGPILPPAGRDPRYLDRISRRLPLRRHGEVRDVTDAVLFLAAADYVTGEIVHVDGGRHVLA